MRAFVFTDDAMKRYAGQFVWLSIDTENDANAKFLQKYPISALPTLLVVDPAHESVVLRYAGGATVGRLSKLLQDGERAYRAKGESESDRLIRTGDRLTNQGQTSEAIKTYEQAIAKAPKSWPRLGRAAESLTFLLGSTDQNERCAEAARELAPHLTGTLPGANVAAGGLICAAQMGPDRPMRVAWIAELEKATRAALDDKSIDMAGDDRSGLYDALVEARDAVKDEAGARRLREEWAAFLEHEAANARTPEQRAVYDSHRLGVYLALKTPEKAIPMLEQSQRDFPNDYNPPARLALTYRAMKRYDDALAASDRALAKAYGPRKLGILRARADIYTARGDNTAARKTIQEAIAFAKALPNGQRSDRTVESLEKTLSSLQR